MVESREIPVTIRIKAIRDGTPGISLAIQDEVIGEWTDSKAMSLILTDKYGIGICDRHGSQRYMLALPGTPVHGEKLSDTEVSVVVRIKRA